jgi:hypothetical protein
MREPTPRSSRLAIAAALLAMLAAGALGFLLGRATPSGGPPAVNEAAPAPAPPPAPPPPPAEPGIMGRAELLALAARSADAAASGGPVPREAGEAVGRRFDLPLPFGCRGPAAGEGAAPLRWSYDESAEVLRVQARARTWSPADWEIAPESGIEAIEGFWIARPWLWGFGWPRATGRAVATGTDAVTLPGQTLAVAQIITGDTRRDARRGTRPFELVRRLPKAELDTSRGFRMRLSGRLGRIPGGGPVRCLQPAGIDQRPICMIAVTLAEVRIENAVDGTVLATWAIGGDARSN